MSSRLEETLAHLDVLREDALADEQRALTAAAEARRRRVQYDAALRALGVGEKKTPKPKRSGKSIRNDGQPSVAAAKIDVVLEALAAAPYGSTQRDLIEVTGLNQGTVSAAVRRLVSADEARVIGTRPSVNGRMQIDVYGLMDRSYPNGNGNGGR